jgi:receptor expression-enhancing protein 1/2/3/4
MVLASPLCRLLLLALGYAYPAYACFKALERRKPEGLRLWCQYWCERGLLSQEKAPVRS